MLRIKTPAKINLFLNIKGQRPDGFHELAMVMQALSLFDELLIEADIESQNIQLLYEPNELGRLLADEDPEQNLVVRAYRAFWQYTKLPAIGLRVTLNKQIPIQAGLGGGSSDAAAMLMALNHLTCASLSLPQLQQLGTTLGSDVPFFFTGGTAYVSGKGDRIDPLGLELGNREWIYAWVLIKPKHFGISTQKAYQAVRQANRYQTKNPEYLLLAMKKLAQASRHHPEHAVTRLKEFENYLLNDFEAALIPHYPQLEEMAAKLRELGVNRPLLSGSGATVAGLLPMTHTHQKLVSKAFPIQDYDVFWTYPHNGGPVQVDIPKNRPKIHPMPTTYPLLR